jgi:hypothetical protein
MVFASKVLAASATDDRHGRGIECSKQALQAALADLLIAATTELKDKKHPGWA